MEPYNEEEYNKLPNIRRAPREIVNYLFNNAPDLWKLLYYTDDTPLNKADLTDEQKANMICKKPQTEDTTTKSILFQTIVDDSFSAAVPQIRIEMGDFMPFNSYRGGILIDIQIIVPNKQKIIVSDYSDVDDRSLAIMQTITKALNGTQLSCFSSKIALSKRADGGAKTGAYRERQNKNYSGYWMTAVALC